MMNILKPQLPPDLTPIEDINILLDKDEDIIDASISNQIAVGVQTEGVAMSYCSIVKSDFSMVTMEKFEIANSEIKSSNFSGGKFPESSWRTVTIDATRCSGLDLQNSILKNIRFSNSKLDIVNFRFATIENMLFENCVLDDADFYGARLKNVDFINCTISKITFANAKMNAVDLSKSTIETINGIASLKGVTINYDQLIQLAPYFATEAGIKIK